MRIEVLLQKLEAEQIALAREAMERPAGRDAFDYGRAVGMYAGLAHARDIMMDLIAERERKDFDL